jgi:hypothetical protein
MVSDVLDEWIKVQRSWLYLQPIFESQDIQKQLPTEHKRFVTVDRNWQTTMLSAKATPEAIKFCANEKILEKFQESNKFLDLVQKGLTEFLETKRRAFARFYFLSDDELLEILSQSKNPLAVQNHLRKCFEGIRSVEFIETQLPPKSAYPSCSVNGSAAWVVVGELGGVATFAGQFTSVGIAVQPQLAYEIVAILSGEDERLNLLSPVATTVRLLALHGFGYFLLHRLSRCQDRPVEVWMTDLEVAMMTCVKAAVYDSTLEYLDVERTNWIQSWQTQCVLTGSQIHWTKDVEVRRLGCFSVCRFFQFVRSCMTTWKQEGITSKGAEGLSMVHAKCISQLRDLVTLIRSPLPDVVRGTLSSLAVLDVHSRDVTMRM